MSIFMLLVLLVSTPLVSSSVQHITPSSDTEGTCFADSSCEQSTKESLDVQIARQNSDSHKEWVNVVITFKNAAGKISFQDKFSLTVSSLLKESSVNIFFIVIGDAESQNIARMILSRDARDVTVQYKVATVNEDKMARELHEIVEPMQRHFSSKGAYYSDSLFFLSIAIHRVMPESLHRVIMIDADLKFKADINDLYALFDEFSKNNILGISRDMQPVYRHTFSRYRSMNKGTRVGEPPPNGLTGFNSGVLLLNLDAMRSSELYNSLLNKESLTTLTQEFMFKGHLGDQDFFTLLSMRYEELFYVLPCGWNRQLCTWWKDQGYEDVFDEYFYCGEPTTIYHGNCNTAIPED